MPRYVILEHDHPTLHWDLMLETGEVLRTWRLASLPQPGHAVKATAIGDHRPIYLDYEGPISGDRGSVKRWDAGTYVVEEEGGDLLRVTMQGQHLQGKAVLSRSGEEEWTFLMEVGGGR